MIGRAILLAMLAAGCVGLLGCTMGPPPGASKKEMPPPQVTVAKPTVKTITQFTDVTGSLKARERVEVRPQVSGYIQKVHFKDGDDVKAGQLLVTIDPSLYRAELNKTKGELASAEASAKQAAVDEARLAKLRNTGSISADEYDKVAAQKAVTAANVLTAQANVERAEKNLEWTKVTARIDGRVDRILITEGNLVSSGTSVLTVLTSTDPIFAYFEIDEGTVLYYLKLISEGRFESVHDRRIPFEFQLKGDEDYPYKGELEFAGTELNAGTGTLTLRGEIKNPAPYKFVSGMFVKARLPGASVKDAILIPDSAAIVDQDKRIVFVVAEGNRIQARPVKLGPLSEGLRVVLEGLKPEETIVVRGLQRVSDGAIVEPVR